MLAWPPLPRAARRLAVSGTARRLTVPGGSRRLTVTRDTWRLTVPGSARHVTVSRDGRRMLGGLLLVRGAFGLAVCAAFALTVRSLVLLQVATLLTQLSYPPSAGTAHLPPAEPQPLNRFRQLLSVTEVPGGRRP